MNEKSTSPSPPLPSPPPPPPLLLLWPSSPLREEEKSTWRSVGRMWLREAGLQKRKEEDGRERLAMEDGYGKSGWGSGVIGDEVEDRTDKWAHVCGIR